MSVEEKKQGDEVIAVIREALPELFLEAHMLEEELESSKFSDKEYAALVLNEMTELTGVEAAERLGVSEGRYWGALGRARDKIEEAQNTLEIASL